MNFEAFIRFCGVTSEIDEVLKSINKSIVRHPQPDKVNWSHVGTQTELLKRLKEVEEFLK